MTNHAKQMLLAALAITATISMLSSHAEAGRKGPQFPSSLMDGFKPNPDMFPKGVKPDLSRFNQGLPVGGQLDPQPRPWVPARQYWSR